MSKRVTRSSVLERATKKVTRALDRSDIALKPKAVELYEVSDALDEDAWRIKLILPAPEGRTWERSSVFALRRKATDVFDEFALKHDIDLPGATIAIVTTDEARLEDIAQDDAEADPESYQ